jgi:hypothetical protein
MGFDHGTDEFGRQGSILHLFVDAGRDAEDDHEHRREQPDNDQNRPDHDDKRKNALDDIHRVLSIAMTVLLALV